MRHVCTYGLALFAVLSLGDFAFTYLLVEGSGGNVIEANPVAAGWLTGHGWLGLALFKAAAVGVVIGSVALIAKHRPALGAAVACAACLAVGAVNVHSHRILSSDESRDNLLAEAYTEVLSGE